MDSRQGYWKARKKHWVAIGIQSDLGRNIDHDVSKGSFRKISNLKHQYDRKVETAGWAPEGWKAEDKKIAKMQDISIFDPVLCEALYTWFCPAGGSILDPFAGGSVRGVVAGCLGHPYHGIDLSVGQNAANRVQGHTIITEGGGLRGRDAVAPVWTDGDSTDVDTLAPGEYDFVFSCPPYADLEVYSEDPNDLSVMGYDEFVAAYRTIIAKCIEQLAPNRFACFVVSEVRAKGTGVYRSFVPDTIRAFEDAGANFYNEIVLLNPAGTAPIRATRQFQGGRKVCRVHQNILVFCKGDPKLAAEACANNVPIRTLGPRNESADATSLFKSVEVDPAAEPTPAAVPYVAPPVVVAPPKAKAAGGLALDLFGEG